MKYASLLPIAATIATPVAAAPRSPALKPLTGTAAARLVDGELRCAFAAPPGTILLLAAADVRPAARPTAAVRFHLLPVRLLARSTGGFDRLSRGATFRGVGTTATVTRGVRLHTGNEETR